MSASPKPGRRHYSLPFLDHLAAIVGTLWSSRDLSAGRTATFLSSPEGCLFKPVRVHAAHRRYSAGWGLNGASHGSKRGGLAAAACGRPVAGLEEECTAVGSGNVRSEVTVSFRSRVTGTTRGSPKGRRRC